ncbi:MAG: radical SAM protein [Nitrospirota bacterium]
MRFVFINPNRAIDEGNIWNVVNSLTPPMGLACLSSVLEEKGFEADIIDAAALGLGFDEIVSSIKGHVDYIGISSTTVEIEHAVELAGGLRRAFPEALILMGGVHPTIFHESLVSEDVCDMVIRGEGEEAIVELAQDRKLEEVPNLTWKSPAGEVIVNAHSDRYVDLEQLPIPSYNKLPMDRYHSALGAAKKNPSVGMITSRGCPGTCTFCYSGMHGKRIRMQSAGKVFDQILFLKKNYGIREISFYDDTFTTNKKRVERLCDLLLQNKTNISWSCFARADTVNPGLLKKMKQAGCHQVGYGFESADEEVLKAINKRVKTRQIDDAVAWTRAAGIDVRGAFMLGNPGETEESMRRTIEYSKQLGIQFAIYNITTPFPGTALYDWSMEQGIVMHRKWVSYDLSHSVLKLPTVGPDTVEQYYSTAYREFYMRPGYIIKRILSLRSGYELKTHMMAFLGMVIGGLIRKK